MRANLNSNFERRFQLHFENFYSVLQIDECYKNAILNFQSKITYLLKETRKFNFSVRAVKFTLPNFTSHFVHQFAQTWQTLPVKIKTKIY